MALTLACSHKDALNKINFCLYILQDMSITSRVVALKFDMAISTIIGQLHILKLLVLTFIQGHKGTIFRIIKMLIFLEVVELKFIRLEMTMVRYAFCITNGNLMALALTEGHKSVSNTCKSLDLNCHISRSTVDVRRLCRKTSHESTCKRTSCRQ